MRTPGSQRHAPHARTGLRRALGSGFLLFAALLLSAGAYADRKADRIVVLKSERVMWLEAAGDIIAAYRIALGDNPKGHKAFEGDERTPEGEYFIDFKNARSSYHLSLRISYPNAGDRLYARSFKRPPGGDIMIHGVGPLQRVSNGKPSYDWTDGCIAVSNEEIEEIWELVEVGTPIVIHP